MSPPLRQYVVNLDSLERLRAVGAAHNKHRLRFLVSRGATAASRLMHAGDQRPLVLIGIVHLARIQTPDLIVSAEHKQQMFLTVLIGERTHQGTLRSAVIELGQTTERVCFGLVFKAAGS